MAQEGGAAPTGRPRDPDLEARVVRAAWEVFGDVGWAGFSMDAVARRARVGKAPLYLRWPRKELLLIDALTAVSGPLGVEETGDVRQDLLSMVEKELALYTGPSGRAARRLAWDTAPSAEVRTALEAFREQRVLRARALVRRAVQRGALPADTQPTVLLDALFGGVFNHLASAPRRLTDDVQSRLAAYAPALVDLVLHGAYGMSAEADGPAGRVPAEGR